MPWSKTFNKLVVRVFLHLEQSATPRAHCYFLIKCLLSPVILVRITFPFLLQFLVRVDKIPAVPLPKYAVQGGIFILAVHAQTILDRELPSNKISRSYLPNTVYFMSKWGCLAYVIKNWEPLVFGPLFAIDNTPRTLCWNHYTSL